MGDQIRSQIGSGGPDPLADLVRGGGGNQICGGTKSAVVPV